MTNFNWRDPRVIAGGVIAAVVLLGVLVVIMIRVGVTNQGNEKQQHLIALYADTTNVLSRCLDQSKQAVGLANAQTTALDKVITDAVQGRYTGDTTARPTGGALFSAIAEQYPNTDKLSEVFGKVLTIITGCRTDFADSQTRLQDATADFETWRTASFRTRNFGGANFPSSALRIMVNNKEITGKAAFKQMRSLVVLSDAQSARDTGTMPDQNLFPTTP